MVTTNDNPWRLPKYGRKRLGKNMEQFLHQLSLKYGNKHKLKNYKGKKTWDNFYTNLPRFTEKTWPLEKLQKKKAWDNFYINNLRPKYTIYIL